MQDNKPLNLFDPSMFGFPAGSAIFGYPPDARKAINEASMRVRGQSVYSQFWTRVLTASERLRLGDDMELSWEQEPCSISLLCSLRQWTAEHAVVEMASKIGFMDRSEHEWLCEVMGGPDPGHQKPKWSRDTGRLEFGTYLCREVRVARAHKICTVLDAFEEEGWPISIDNPITSNDPQKIHEIVRSLNTNLNLMRFGAVDSRICWQLSD